MSADLDRRTAGSVQASSGERAMNQPALRVSVLSALLLAGTAVVLFGPGCGWADEPSKPAVGQPYGLQVPSQIFVVNAQDLTQERLRNRVVGQTREALSRSGAVPLYAPVATSELALREAVIEALHHNLDIKRSGLAKASAERAKIEADAVFDPVFAASFNATLTDQFRRIEAPNKFKPATDYIPLGQADKKGVFRCTAQAAELTQDQNYQKGCYVITFGTRAITTATQFNRPREAGYYPLDKSLPGEGIAANSPSPFQPRNDQVYNGSVSLFQQLPWGPSLNLSITSRRQNKYYSVNAKNGLDQTFSSYNRPYFTTIAMGAALPLPYTKNFGPTAVGDTQIDLARHAIDAAELDVRTVINSTLLQVDGLYWQLVGAVYSMEVANQSLDLAEKQRASVQRMFDQGFVTESDRNQVEAQVSRIRAQQQQLFGSYVTASEALRRALDSKDDALLLPVGYQGLMKRPAGDIVEPDRILNNPGYQRQAVAVRIAGLVRNQRDAQTRPDLSATASVTLAETGSFGYQDVTNSFSRAFTNHDQLVLSLGLLYQRPIGNRAALAALDQADHALNQQAMALHQVELATREDFEVARGALASTREQVRLNERAVTLAQEVYDSSITQQELGLVAAYESISRLSALLSARTQLVQSKIALRSAESRLLASVGALAERYGELTAQTGIDLERLALLRESGALKHFGGPL